MQWGIIKTSVQHWYSMLLAIAKRKHNMTFFRKDEQLGDRLGNLSKISS